MLAQMFSLPLQRFMRNRVLRIVSSSSTSAPSLLPSSAASSMSRSFNPFRFFSSAHASPSASTPSSPPRFKAQFDFKHIVANVGTIQDNIRKRNYIHGDARKVVQLYNEYLEMDRRIKVCCNVEEVVAIACCCVLFCAALLCKRTLWFLLVVCVRDCVRECASICLYVCMDVCVCVCVCMCVCICLCVYLCSFVCLFVRFFVFFLSVSVCFVRLFFLFFLCVCVCISVCIHFFVLFCFRVSANCILLRVLPCTRAFSTVVRNNNAFLCEGTHSGACPLT